MSCAAQKADPRCLHCRVALAIIAWSDENHAGKAPPAAVLAALAQVAGEVLETHPDVEQRMEHVKKFLELMLGVMGADVEIQDIAHVRLQ